MDSLDKKLCRRRRLAQRGSFTVDECECGAIHLTIGYVTIRLERCAYHEMASAVFEALGLVTQSRSTSLLS